MEMSWSFILDSLLAASPGVVVADGAVAGGAVAEEEDNIDPATVGVVAAAPAPLIGVALDAALLAVGLTMAS